MIQDANAYVISYLPKVGYNEFFFFLHVLHRPFSNHMQH